MIPARFRRMSEQSSPPEPGDPTPPEPDRLPIGERLHASARPDSSETEAPPEPAAGREESQPDDSWGYELLLYGNEQILRGSDNGTLVAFAGIALVEIRGDAQFHNNVGCAILLVSVLLCALIHFTMGYAYIGQAKNIIRRGQMNRKGRALRRFSIWLSVLFVLIQFACIFLGCWLIVAEKPPALLETYLLPFFR